MLAAVGSCNNVVFLCFAYYLFELMQAGDNGLKKNYSIEASSSGHLQLWNLIQHMGISLDRS